MVALDCWGLHGRQVHEREEMRGMEDLVGIAVCGDGWLVG